MTERVLWLEIELLYSPLQLDVKTSINLQFAKLEQRIIRPVAMHNRIFRACVHSSRFGKTRHVTRTRKQRNARF